MKRYHTVRYFWCSAIKVCYFFHILYKVILTFAFGSVQLSRYILGPKCCHIKCFLDWPNLWYFRRMQYFSSTPNKTATIFNNDTYMSARSLKCVTREAVQVMLHRYTEKCCTLISNTWKIVAFVLRTTLYKMLITNVTRNFVFQSWSNHLVKIGHYHIGFSKHNELTSFPGSKLNEK